jgi:hypothetical protein
MGRLNSVPLKELSFTRRELASGWLVFLAGMRCLEKVVHPILKDNPANTRDDGWYCDKRPDPALP